jgi:hypothetical protein
MLSPGFAVITSAELSSPSNTAPLTSAAINTTAAPASRGERFFGGATVPDGLDGASAPNTPLELASATALGLGKAAQPDADVDGRPPFPWFWEMWGPTAVTLALAVARRPPKLRAM